jgi:hypothetical protein
MRVGLTGRCGIGRPMNLPEPSTYTRQTTFTRKCRAVVTGERREVKRSVLRELGSAQEIHWSGWLRAAA